MDQRVRSQLSKLVDRFGANLGRDPLKCRAVLKDMCPQSRCEIAVLVAAAEEGIPAELILIKKGTPISVTLRRLTQRLENDRALVNHAAQWAVESWALALKVVTEAGLSVNSASQASAPFSSAQVLGIQQPSPSRKEEESGSIPTDPANYDVETNIQITIPDAYKGGKQRVRIDEKKVLEVSIPSGITPGKKIRLKGQGCPIPRGGAGDLYLKVEFREHPFYQLQGSDLCYDLPVSPSEAVLGAQVEIPTLDGLVKLRIPAGVQSGQKMRLRRRGFPKGEGERGDLFVTIQIVVPEQLSSQERGLYEQLQQVQSYDPRSEVSF